MTSVSITDRCIDSIDPVSLPDHGSTTYPSYGSGHVRPLLALSRPVGDFEVDLTMFREGMPVSCKYIVKDRSHGWFKGIIHRIYKYGADIDYDDGDYDYNVSFHNLRHLGIPKKRKFTVEPIPAPEAIVLSISHAHEAIAHADRLVKRIKSRLSTPKQSMSQSSVYVSSDDVSSDDEVEFVREGFSSMYGSSERPIIL